MLRNSLHRTRMAQTRNAYKSCNCSEGVRHLLSDTDLKQEENQEAASCEVGFKPKYIIPNLAASNYPNTVGAPHDPAQHNIRQQKPDHWASEDT